MRHAPLVILMAALHIGPLQAQIVRGQVVDSITQAVGWAIFAIGLGYARRAHRPIT
jgi:hypothetical protein